MTGFSPSIKPRLRPNCVNCGSQTCKDCGRCHAWHCDAEQLCEFDKFRYYPRNYSGSNKTGKREFYPITPQKNKLVNYCEWCNREFEIAYYEEGLLVKLPKFCSYECDRAQSIKINLIPQGRI